jgi:hypothetical protein
MCTSAGAIDLTEGLEHVLFVLGIEARACIVTFKLKLDFVRLEAFGLNDGTPGEHLTLAGKLDGILLKSVIVPQCIDFLGTYAYDIQ